MKLVPLYFTLLFCTVLYCSVLYSTVLYSTLLYSTVQYFSLLCSTLLCLVFKISTKFSKRGDVHTCAVAYDIALHSVTAQCAENRIESLSSPVLSHNLRSSFLLHYASPLLITITNCSFMSHFSKTIYR